MDVLRSVFLVCLAGFLLLRGASAQELRAQPDLPTDLRAVVMVGGDERIVSAEEAARAGYTIVSLRDDWTPYIFEDLLGPDAAPRPNRYRTIFLGLASDQTDADGQPLREHDGEPKRKQAPPTPPPPP